MNHPIHQRHALPQSLWFDQTARGLLRGSTLVRHMPLAMLIAATAWLAAALPARAASVCRWVDDSGRTQVSDVVPLKYSKVATCTDSKQHELPPEAVRRAQERAAQDKLSAAESDKERSRPASAPSTAKPASAPAGAKKPAQELTKDTDCATWRRLYDESLECFGPYRTTRGATKPEAFDKCNPIPSPNDACGARIQ